MKRRVRLTLPLIAAGLLTTWGCGPPEITQALPPGMEPMIEEVPEGQEAQALGEQQAMGAIPGPSASVPLAPPTDPGQTSMTTSGVAYQTLKAGDGDEATAGKTAVIHYDLKLENGQAVENSRSRGQTYSFRIQPGGGAIDGMTQGVSGMKVGEVRKLTIPPELGYGSQPSGEIPGNSTLIFEVELMDVE